MIFASQEYRLEEDASRFPALLGTKTTPALPHSVDSADPFQTRQRRKGRCLSSTGLSASLSDLLAYFSSAPGRWAGKKPGRAGKETPAGQKRLAKQK